MTFEQAQRAKDLLDIIDGLSIIKKELCSTRFLQLDLTYTSDVGKENHALISQSIHIKYDFDILDHLIQGINQDIERFKRELEAL